MMLRNLFLINYRNFIETGVYNLSSQIIPQFLEQLRTDIAVAQGQIKTARQILKIEKLPPDHPRVVKINADIELFKDMIKVNNHDYSSFSQTYDKRYWSGE